MWAYVGAVVVGSVAQGAARNEMNKRRAALGLPPEPFPELAPRREPEQRHTVDDGSAAAAFVFGMAMAGSHNSQPESCTARSFDSGGGGDFGGGGASGEF
jgi:uncharacterized membrane protein YgcG